MADKGGTGKKRTSRKLPNPEGLPKVAGSSRKIPSAIKPRAKRIVNESGGSGSEDLPEPSVANETENGLEGETNKLKQELITKSEQIIQLEAQLEVARQSQDELLELARSAESSNLKKALEEAQGNDSIKNKLIDDLRKEVAMKDRQLMDAHKEIEKLREELKKIPELQEELDDANERCDQAHKRAEEQAAEVGSTTAELDTLKERQAEKEKRWEELAGVHRSQTAILESDVAKLKGEIASLKSFSIDQTRFVDDLGEENAKLVAEIKRLKEQAKTRDQQLQESVSLARDAIIREKKKRAEWERRNRQSRA